MQIVQQQRQASARCCEAVGVLAAVGVSAAVGVVANARQQNIIEWLKGVRRYELFGCLRQAVRVDRSYETGGTLYPESHLAYLVGHTWLIQSV